MGEKLLMTDFSSQKAFLAALDAHDFVAIKRCFEAGQSLQDKQNGIDDPIFHLACLRQDSARFQACMALGKKFVDVNASDSVGANCIGYSIFSEEPWRLSVC